MANWESIGDRIREFREERGLHRVDVAKRIGVGAKHVEKIEHGTSGISVDTLIAFARAYNVSLDELLLNRKPRDCDYRVTEIRRLAQEILNLTDEKSEKN